MKFKLQNKGFTESQSLLTILAVGSVLAVAWASLNYFLLQGYGAPKRQVSEHLIVTTEQGIDRMVTETTVS